METLNDTEQKQCKTSVGMYSMKALGYNKIRQCCHCIIKAGMDTEVKC